jgi:hypothetical protein
MTGRFPYRHSNGAGIVVEVVVDVEGVVVLVDVVEVVDVEVVVVDVEVVVLVLVGVEVVLVDVIVEVVDGVVVVAAAHRVVALLAVAVRRVLLGEPSVQVWFPELRSSTAKTFR